ncbi:MAG: glycosyltransferase family 4 protein [Chloroflexota bacterium]
MSVSLSAFMFHVVLVAFEGPDRYSFVGGLATRMIDLSGALLDRGHRVHHLFVGDPSLPTREERYDGQHVLERWGQWISRYHPKDVYDGEDGKYLDFSRTVPTHLASVVIAAAAARGERSVVLFEDWQTAAAAIGTATLLSLRGDRSAALFWNANNTYGFGQVDFPLLRRAASITTISRYMRMELAKVEVEAAVLPNGIAERYLKPLPPSDVAALRKAFGDRPTFVKIARFDVDKRWLWAVDATAAMRDAGMRPRFIIRGSRSAYADVVGARIRARGLSVDRLVLPPTATSRDLAAAIATTTTEVVFLDFFIDEKALRSLYAAADGVLANSEKEPFGLVGLEVMAAGGIAYLGRTGEDYAVPFGNSIVVQSDDPRELLTSYLMLRERPELARSIRADGRATAKRFAWPRILEGYESVWETAFALTS